MCPRVRNPTHWPAFVGARLWESAAEPRRPGAHQPEVRKAGPQRASQSQGASDDNALLPANPIAPSWAAPDDVRGRGSLPASRYRPFRSLPLHFRVSGAFDCLGANCWGPDPYLVPEKSRW